MSNPHYMKREHWRGCFFFFFMRLVLKATCLESSHEAAEPSAQVHAANQSAGGSVQQRGGGPPRHTHSTPSDGDEVAAAVDQQSDSSVSTADPEVFFQRGYRWQCRPTDIQPPERPSVEITALSPPTPPPRAHPSIASIDVTQLHALRSDHLSPIHQDGKCAH